MSKIIAGGAASSPSAARCRRRRRPAPSPDMGDAESGEEAVVGCCGGRCRRRNRRRRTRWHWTVRRPAGGARTKRMKTRQTADQHPKTDHVRQTSGPRTKWSGGRSSSRTAYQAAEECRPIEAVCRPLVHRHTQAELADVRVRVRRTGSEPVPVRRQAHILPDPNVVAQAYERPDAGLGIASKARDLRVDRAEAQPSEKLWESAACPTAPRSSYRRSAGTWRSPSRPRSPPAARSSPAP